MGEALLVRRDISSETDFSNCTSYPIYLGRTQYSGIFQIPEEIDISSIQGYIFLRNTSVGLYSSNGTLLGSLTFYDEPTGNADYASTHAPSTDIKIDASTRTVTALSDNTGNNLSITILYKS